MKAVNAFLKNYAIESFHREPLFTSALAQVSNFLAHAVNAIFFGFPACTSRKYISFSRLLCFVTAPSTVSVPQAIPVNCK
jgi:hypothetical protein